MLDFNLLKGLGFIVRMVGFEWMKKELLCDFVYLLRLWKVIVWWFKKYVGFVDIYEESDMIICMI